jgi:hypothetical protein
LPHRHWLCTTIVTSPKYDSSFAASSLALHNNCDES